MNFVAIKTVDGDSSIRTICAYFRDSASLHAGYFTQFVPIALNRQEDTKVLGVEFDTDDKYGLYEAGCAGSDAFIRVDDVGLCPN